MRFRRSPQKPASTTGSPAASTSGRRWSWRTILRGAGSWATGKVTERVRRRRSDRSGSRMLRSAWAMAGQACCRRCDESAFWDAALGALREADDPVDRLGAFLLLRHERDADVAASGVDPFGLASQIAP